MKGKLACPELTLSKGPIDSSSVHLPGKRLGPGFSLRLGLVGWHAGETNPGPLWPATRTHNGHECTSAWRSQAVAVTIASVNSRPNNMHQLTIKFWSCSGATLGIVKHSVLSTTPTAEIPALSDEERAERRGRLAERMFSPDGLDRDTLEHIEQLTADES